MKCQYCRSKCVKNGRQKNGIQKYRCKSCNKYQQEEYKYQACIKFKKELIVPMVVNNVGFRGVSRVLKISVNTVRNVVVKSAKELKPPVVPSGGTYEVDEMLVYHKKGKTEIWAVYAIERKSKIVIGINVGRRTKATLRKTINAIMITNPRRVYTDGLSTYRSLIPEVLHKKLSLLLTNIERQHLNARNSLKMLNHKTLAFVRDERMLLSCLKLLFWGK